MTIYTTYPTRPIVAVDAPEPKDFDVKFVYNFFTNDESINDVGTELTQFSDEAALQNKLQRDVSRYNVLSWKRPVVSDYEEQFSNANPLYGNITVDLNQVYQLSKTETDFSTTIFSAIRFQDNTIDRKLFTLVSGTINRYAELYNADLTDIYGITLQSINDALKLSPNSLLDAAKLIASDDPTTDNMIVDALSNIEFLNANYLDDQKQDTLISSRFDALKESKLDVQLNTKFAYTALYDVVTDPIGIFTDELIPSLEQIRSAQINAINATEPTVISTDDYEFYIDPIDVGTIDYSEFAAINYNTPRKLIGYIIDRYEILNSGKSVKLNPIIINNIDTEIVYDSNIKYGKRYRYEIRSVVAIQFLTTQNSGYMELATTLITSQPMKFNVETIENVPPPWPADFQVSWDRQRKKPRLTWSYPVTQQRDVKRFQVFRRSSLDEPYQLIKEYDFDDSLIKYISGEKPDEILVEKTSFPPLFYIDDEFSINSKFIYTLGCVDAHGLVSNFSSQLEISFDPIKNSVKRNLISGPNAPRPYPNMYVTQDDVIIDLIKDSRHNKAKLYFDPEYIDVLYEKRPPRSADLLALNTLDSEVPTSKYKLQILNVDLQKAKTIDIVINDMRTP